MLLSTKENIAEGFIVQSGTIHLRTDDIITFAPNPLIKKLKMEYFYENLEIYKSLTKDGKKPFLTDNRIKFDYTAEQKKFMQEKLPVYFSKVAVIIQGDFNKFVFNSFMYLYRPKVPIKSFNNIEKAINWLK